MTTRAPLLLLALAVAACGAPRPASATPTPTATPTTTTTAAASPIPVSAAGPLQAGVARVDITPPPGVSTFGHAPDAHVTDGEWTRLYCRVFVLRTGDDPPVALVPCDLPAISGLLHHAVLDALGGKGVPATRVFLAATHTHAGPAHYFESYAYGGVASTRLPGYDPAMVAFLANRIAGGIQRASAPGAMRPAVARWEHGIVWGLTRNRSLDAFLANDDSVPLPEYGPPAAPDDATPEERAVDPRLDVLQIEAADAAGRPAGPIGWLVLFAMHPTVLPATNRPLGADTHGVISRMLESQLRRSAAARARPAEDPLVGIFNTNEGDVSPVWSVGDHAEVVRVAGKVAGRVAALYDAPLPAWRRDVVLDAHYLQRYLPAAWLLHTSARLCEHPELGTATGHGGSDHRCTLDAILPPADDVDLTRTDCQAPKHALLGGLQNILLGPEPTRYPTDVAFGMVRVDDMWMSMVPGELTVHAGAMLVDRVQALAGAGARPRVVGLSNGYIQYITTPLEYAMQRYEGGSTLYGPRSAEYFADQAEILARAMMGQRLDRERLDQVWEPDFELAPAHHRFPDPSDGKAVSAIRTPRVTHGVCRLPGGDPISLCTWWTDAAPGVVPTSPSPAGESPWIELVRADGSPLHVCATWPWLGAAAPGAAACDPSATIDDRGVDFLTTVRGRHRDGYLWSTIFRPSALEWTGLHERVRIRARGAAGAAPVDSDAFSPTELPWPCTAAQAAMCNLTE